MVGVFKYDTINDKFRNLELENIIDFQNIHLEKSGFDGNKGPGINGKLFLKVITLRALFFLNQYFIHLPTEDKVNYDKCSSAHSYSQIVLVYTTNAPTHPF